MNIAVIISAHGKIAEQLLNTVETILGPQENVNIIDFSPGENIKQLNDEFNKKIESLDVSQGLLFLVDVWGGSPFNIAKNITSEHENYDIISGVNVPMLLDIFIAREDTPNISNLVSIALKSGQNGIKSRKKQIKQTSFSIINDDTHAEETSTTTDNNHMSLALTRIDDRLIHSQVITHWAKEINAKYIIIVNDNVSKDDFRKELIKKITPPNIITCIFNINEMIHSYNSYEYSNEQVILILTNPSDALILIENGIKIKSINVAGMTFKQGKKKISDSIFVDDSDILVFNSLNDRGIEIECRKVMSDNRVNIMDLIKHI